MLKEEAISEQQLAQHPNGQGLNALRDNATFQAQQEAVTEHIQYLQTKQNKRWLNWQMAQVNSHTHNTLSQPHVLLPYADQQSKAMPQADVEACTPKRCRASKEKREHKLNIKLRESTQKENINILKTL